MSLNAQAHEVDERADNCSNYTVKSLWCRTTVAMAVRFRVRYRPTSLLAKPYRIAPDNGNWVADKAKLTAICKTVDFQFRN